jgi:hypothetical protein
MEGQILDFSSLLAGLVLIKAAVGPQAVTVVVVVKLHYID